MVSLVPRLALAFLLLSPAAILAWISWKGSPDLSALDALQSGDTWIGFAAAGLAAVVAMVLGLGPGLLLASPRRRGALRHLGLATVLAPLALPTVAIGGCWSSILNLGPAPLADPGSRICAWAGLALAFGIAFSPLAALGIALSWRHIPRPERIAAQHFLRRGRRLLPLLWSRLSGPLLFLFLALFGLAAHDALTPAHFGVETLASRLLAEQQSRLAVASVASDLLLVWASIAAVAVLLLTRLRHRAEDLAPPDPSAPSWSVAATALSATLAFVVPMIWSARRDPAIAQHLPELFESLRIALIALVSAAVLGAAAASWPGRARPLALPLLVLWMAPPLAIALALQVLVAATPPPVEDPLFALGILWRCLPWALLTLLILPRSQAERSASALGVRWISRARELARERAGLGALLAALAASAAALREATLYAVAAPPGRESLAARATHLLHFGFGPELAGVLLIQGLLAFVWALCVLLPFSRMRNSARTQSSRAHNSTRDEDYALALGGVVLRQDHFQLGPLDLRLGRGEILALLGPSGAGKSSVIEICCGLRSPDAGQLLRPLGKDEVAALLDDPGLFPAASARRNLQMVNPTIDAEELLDRVGFEARRDQASRSLSAGERQRVALARILASPKRLVLLDEAGSHLDDESWNEVGAELGRQLRSQGRSAVAAAHQLEQLLPLQPDRIWLLEDGQTIADGPLDELISHPPSEEVARRLGYEIFLRGRRCDEGLQSALGNHRATPRSPGQQGLAWRLGEIRVAGAGGLKSSTSGRIARVLRKCLTSRGPAVLVELASKERILALGEAEEGSRIDLEWEGGVPVLLDSTAGQRGKR